MSRISIQVGRCCSDLFCSSSHPLDKLRAGMVCHPKGAESAHRERGTALLPPPALPSQRRAHARDPSPVGTMHWILARGRPTVFHALRQAGRRRPLCLAFHGHHHLRPVQGGAADWRGALAPMVSVPGDSARLASAGHVAGQGHPSVQMPDARLTQGPTFVGMTKDSL